jgi:hypothetical protein
MKYNVVYEQEVISEVYSLPVDTVDEAIALVREVIYDGVNIKSVSVDNGGGYVEYSDVVSSEAQVNAVSKDEAGRKVLLVLPDARITDIWELKHKSFPQAEDGERIILNEEDESL